jgi:hypothetical protein
VLTESPGDVAARLWLERVVKAVDIDPNKTWTDIERMDHK